jgi:hypothetical protein
VSSAASAPAGGISCRDSTRLVSQMRDRPLDGTETAQLQTHVAQCPHCRIAAQQFADLFARVDLLLARNPQGDRR